MKPGHSFWTKAEIEKLKAMCAAGYTYVAAAQELGRTKDSIHGKARNMGLVFAKAAPGVRPGKPSTPAPEPILPAVPRYRSFTAALFGDPPIGRSALDQKRRQA